MFNRSLIVTSLVLAALASTQASAAVLSNPTTVSGMNAIDPEGSQTLDQDGTPGNGYSRVSRDILRARSDYQAVQVFTGFVNGTNYISFTSASLLDIRIEGTTGSGANYTSNPTLRTTSDDSGIGVVCPSAGTNLVASTAQITITFGDYETSTSSFTATAAGVQAVGFTYGNMVDRTTVTVTFKDAGGNVLCIQTAAGNSSDNDNGSNVNGSNSGSDVYFGYQSDTNNIASVEIVRSNTANGTITGTIDDLGFTAVPEAASLALAVIPAAMLVGRRKNK